VKNENNIDEEGKNKTAIVNLQHEPILKGLWAHFEIFSHK
jgi:hypothetical protein